MFETRTSPGHHDKRVWVTTQLGIDARDAIHQSIDDVHRAQCVTVVRPQEGQGCQAHLGAEELPEVRQRHAGTQDVGKCRDAVERVDQVERDTKRVAVTRESPPRIVGDAGVFTFDSVHVDDERLESRVVGVRQAVEQVVGQMVVVDAQVLQRSEGTELRRTHVDNAVTLRVLFDARQVQRAQAGRVVLRQGVNQGPAVDQQVLDAPQRDVTQLATLFDHRLNQIEISDTKHSQVN